MHLLATLSVQLRIRSVLVDWYRVSTSVPLSHLSFHLSPLTDNRLRYCSNCRNNPSKFYVPDNLTHLKHLDDKYTEFLYSLSIPILFHRMQNSVSKNLSKRIHPISQQVQRQLAASKLVRSEKKSRAKKPRQNSRGVFKKYNLEATKKSTFLGKRIIARKNNFLLRH